MAEDQPSAALVEVDHDEYDSAVGGDSIRDSTTSIASSVLKYREENGRTCTYRFTFSFPKFMRNARGCCSCWL
jgi:hypothetical protein